jgi:hypothetical protein
LCSFRRLADAIRIEIYAGTQSPPRFTEFLVKHFTALVRSHSDIETVSSIAAGHQNVKLNNQRGPQLPIPRCSRTSYSRITQRSSTVRLIRSNRAYADAVPIPER